MKTTNSSLIVHVCTLLFGLSAVIGKEADAGIMTLIFGRAFFAAMSLGIIMLIFCRKTRLTSLADIIKLLMNGVLLGVHWICFFTGIKEGGIAIGMLGFACFPAFVALFEAVIMRQLPSWSDYIIITMIVIGLVIISPAGTPGISLTPGLIWGIAAGFTSAAFMIANRYIRTSATPLETTFWLCAGCTIFSLPGANGLISISQQDFNMLVFLGVICTGFAFTLLVIGLKNLSARKVAFITALEPVYAILSAWVLLSQPASLNILLGASLIIGAAIISSRIKSKNPEINYSTNTQMREKNAQ